MKNTWKKLMAALCAASLLLTLPGVAVYAAGDDFFEEPEMAEEAAEQSDDVVAPTEILEEPAESIDPAEVDVPYPEDAENAAQTVDLPEEYDLPSEDIPAEETVGAPTGTYQVGYNVYANYDSKTGNINLYSTTQSGATLWSDWLERAGIGRNSVKSIHVVQRLVAHREWKINLPADSRGSVLVDGDYEPRLFGSLYYLTDISFSGFNTSNVTDMSYMFNNCAHLTTLDLGIFNTSKVTSMRGMFYGCNGLTNLNLTSFDTSNVTTMEEMFYECSNLTSLNLSSFTTSKVETMLSMFEFCEKLTSLELSGFNTTRLTKMGDMFNTCRSLKTIDLSSFNTSKVKSMVGLFMDCESLTKVNLSGLNTSNVIDMSKMFESCESLKAVDVSSLDTSKVIYMSFMFHGCRSLTTIDLSKFNTSNVNYMDGMFMDCINLTRLDLRSFITSKVVDMNALFLGCNKLKYLDIGSFDMSHINIMSGIFSECNALELLITPNKIKYTTGSEFEHVMYDRDGKKYSKLPSTAGSKVLGRTKALAASIFLDVRDPSHPYYKAIYWAVEKGITKGYPDGTFGIDRSCTRGEMMMFLWRFAGKPEPTSVSKSPFKDVPKTHTFYKAILWGSQKGITKGYPDGTFGVNRNVTRGESMMFLWRLKGKKEPTAVSVSPFKDVPKTHTFYKAILWGYQKGITTGYTSGAKKGTFGINENCTRGQIVTFLYRAK